jgi:hypothetical protein
VQVSPDNGFALQTNFLIATTGWSDDPADLPLSYDFEYRWVFCMDFPSRVLVSVNDRNCRTISSHMQAGSID